jgi:hypothetical protein
MYIDAHQSTEPSSNQSEIIQGMNQAIVNMCELIKDLQLFEDLDSGNFNPEKKTIRQYAKFA